MKLKKDSSEQKLRGAYYTPLRLANAMVSLFAPENIQTVLEPSCGDGVFLDSLFSAGLMEQISMIKAVEIESEEAIRKGITLMLFAKISLIFIKKDTKQADMI